MSINTTPFLHLPQWTAEEHPSFLSEMNQAYAAIDTGYGDVKTLAQTGVNESAEAVDTANGAKQQSQANAGAITTLQQSLTQLEADYVNSHSAKHVTLQCTPVDGIPVTINWGRVTYNDYFAHFEFSFRFTENFNNTNTTASAYPIINIDGVPGTIRQVLGLTNAVASNADKNAQYTAGCYLKQNVIELLKIRPQDTINLGSYVAVFSVPIFISPSTKEALMDGCMYI